MKPSEVLAVPGNGQAILDIIAKYQGENPRYFGSTLRGNDREGSDLDIVFDAKRPLEVNLSALKQELQTRLGIPVDVLTAAALGKRFGETVVQHAQPIQTDGVVKTMPIFGKTFHAYLRDMQEAITDIYYAQESLAKSEHDMDSREGRRNYNSLVRSFQVIGEAANRIQKKFPDELSDNPNLAVAASQAYGLRNVLVHDYDTINFGELQKIMENDLPELDSLIQEILDDEDFPSPF